MEGEENEWDDLLESVGNYGKRQVPHDKSKNRQSDELRAIKLRKNISNRSRASQTSSTETDPLLFLYSPYEEE